MTSLAAKAADEELEDINDFVGSLSLEELFDLADGIVGMIMPGVENLKKRGSGSAGVSAWSSARQPPSSPPLASAGRTGGSENGPLENP